tara:strand:+ start:2093 stop:2320 length:228 start_codon:yes stop_codon:yes gene_type:complete
MNNEQKKITPTHDDLVKHFGGGREADRALAKLFLGHPVEIPEEWSVDGILFAYHVKEKTIAFLLDRLMRDRELEI